MIWKDRIKQYPHRYTLTNVSGSTYDFAEVTGEVHEAGTPVNAENMNKLLEKTGDAKDTVTTFTEASTRANIATGEKTSTIFGKIKKFFTDLKPHAFNDLATVQGTETDKAPTNKLLNDTAALKFDKTDISTVMPISSAAASNDKVLGEKVVYDEFATKSYADSVPAYDKIIRTQTEFEELIADSTWLGATSVALVGQFTYSEANNGGIKIPDTVKQIHGFNSAKITVTNFVWDSSTAKGGLWYDTIPTTPDYSICDLEVDCTGTFGYGFYSCTNLTNCTGTGTGTYSGYGFYSCTNLTNCTGKGTGTGTYSGYGFYSCSNLTNCTGTATGEYGIGCGFYSCSNLTNCTGTGSGTGNGFGFRSCSNLTNCTGTATGEYGYGFRSCSNLTNCIGTGTGTDGFGFYDITHASNCRDGGSKTAMWGGANSNIDIDTCCKTPVEANNTTLNT